MRPRLLASMLFLACAACGADEVAPAAPLSSEAETLVHRLQAGDAATRRLAAEALGATADVSLVEVRALLQAQHDDEPSVAVAALAALDRIQPAPGIAERIEARGRLMLIEQVLVAPARLGWTQVDCPGIALDAHETLAGCWHLAMLPAVVETRVKHVTPVPGTSLPEPATARRAVWRAVGPADWTAVPGAALNVPADISDAAEPGEVWCQILGRAGFEWRRAAPCESSR